LDTIDVVKQMIPWTNTAWTQVHSGSLPLWNPYDGLGLPLAFNWQSATFSVPSLVGYLFPLRDAFTVGVVVTLVIAGTGGYVLGRVLRLRLLGALTIATVFELSGPLMAWLGFPQAQTMAWGGWLFAAALLILRGERRVQSIALFAVVLACAIYSGHPETLVTVVGATLLLVALVLVSRSLPARLSLPRGPLRRPALDAVVALLVGSALSAPLLLPGVQLLSNSVRTATPTAKHLPLHDTLHLLFSSYDGVQIPGNFGFGDSFYYNETAAYIGVIALVLAVVGIVAGVLRRRPEVLAFAIVGVVLAALVFSAPVEQVANAAPGWDVNWLRALMPLGLVLATLAGIGVDALLDPGGRPVLRIWLLGGFVVAALLVASLWLFDRGNGLPNDFFGPAWAMHLRSESFVWPVVGIVVGLVVAALLLRRGRWTRVGLTVLVACEAWLLLYAGSILISSSSNGYPPTQAVQLLQRSVGEQRVAAGGSQSCAFGFIPNSNMLYGVHDIDVNDPIIPATYFSDWMGETGTSAGIDYFNEFCPQIKTAAEARSLGVSYLLEPAGSPAPPGTTFVRTLRVPNPYNNSIQKPPGDEDLYYVPRSGVATLSTSGRSTQSGDQGGTRVTRLRLLGSNPAQIHLTTQARTSGVLNVHVTGVPGWHATIDGRPLALESSSVFGVRASIPAGTHHIELRYWPSRFTVGLVVALIAAVGLVVALIVDARRRARRADRALEASSPT
jgi:uncharacterized membrane protein